MKKLLLASVAALFATSVAAQSVQQSGTVTPGHPVRWVTNGIVGDGGTPQNGLLSGIGTQTNGYGYCQKSAPVTGPYNQLCLGVFNSAAAQIWLQNFGGATAQDLILNINGTTTALPGNATYVAPAIKLPVDLATTANITLSGEQTIDGVLTAASRVLVKDQSTASQNGIYVTSAGAWTRATDWNTPGQVVQGTAVRVTKGTLNANRAYYVTTANPITIGSTAIALDNNAGTINITQTASGAYGSGTVMGWLLNDQSTGGPVTQLNIQHPLTGSLWSGQHATIGITSQINSDPAIGATFSNILPLQTNAYGNVLVTPSKMVDVFGANWYVTVAAGATGYNSAIGQEIDVGISSTGGATSRVGLQIIGAYPQGHAVGDTGKRGTVNDIAYFIDATSAATSWAFGYSWDTNAFDSTSTIVGSPAPTNASVGIDFSHVTFSGPAFRSPNFQVNGDGALASASHTISGDLDVTDGTSRLRLIGAGGVNFIESGNAAFNASANLSITGYLGNTLSTLSLVASTVSLTGTLSVASSINKVTVTAPATSATITMADGSTLVTSGAHSLTLTTGADSIVTFPAAGTLATLGGAEALSNKAITASTLDNSAIGAIMAASGKFTTVVASSYVQSGVTVVASLPTCNAGSEGARMYVTDQATAVAYRGAVTGSGATRQAVLCSNSAWIQD